MLILERPRGYYPGVSVNTGLSLARNLVAAYRRLGNTWIDVSGNAPPMQPHNTPTHSFEPKIQEYSSYVTASNQGSFNTKSRAYGGTGTYTIACWVRVQSLQSGTTVFWIPFGLSNVDGSAVLYIQITPSGVSPSNQFRAVGYDGTNAPTTNGAGSTITTNVWHFVVASIDTNTVTIKQNDSTVVTKSSTLVNKMLVTSSSIGMLGIQSLTPFPYTTQPFTGDIALPMIWNRLLTEAEKDFLYANPLALYSRPCRIYIPTSTAAATAPSITSLSARLITATSAQPRISYS